MAITVTQLNTFLAVIRGGSVTAAADELVVTQPSVSSAISSLGRELGCELFQRSGRGVALTAAGDAFAPYAADVVGLLSSGRQAAREAGEVEARRLRLIAVTTAAESFVPPLMHAFSELRPEIELMLDVGNRQTVLARIQSHESDVAILGRPPADERLESLPLVSNEIVCIAAPDDPAVGRTGVRATELADRSWLLRESGSGTRALNERFLEEQGIAPQTLTLGSNGAIRQAVRAGLGVSLVSRETVEGEFESGRLGEIRLRDRPPPRTWFVVRSAVGPVREVVREFVAFAAGQRRQSAPTRR
jgi:DNA-binding transcriptional LysR family regulator